MKKTALLGMSEFGAIMLLAFLWKLRIKNQGKESVCYSLPVSVQEQLCENPIASFVARPLGDGVALKGVKESDKQQKESPPFESRGSEQTPLLSKLSLRGESRWSWIYS